MLALTKTAIVPTKYLNFINISLIQKKISNYLTK